MTQAANLGALGTNAGTTGILPAAGGGTAGTGGAIGFKNRLINGNMTIAQRGTSSINNDTSATQYPIDRWSIYGTQNSKFSAQQDAGAVTPPAGFNDYLGMTSLAATSLGATDIFTLQQRIEGYNVADLNWGTANAKTVTLSFWVRSSLTGTFGGALINSAGDRSYPFSYTISAANTWEYETITITGDTTGTWLVTNGIGLRVNFSLGAGSTYSGTAGAWVNSFIGSVTGAVSVVGTNGATWYTTGCQLEVGTAATNFDFRSIGTELQLCQRYYYLHSSWAAAGNAASMISLISLYTGTDGRGMIQFPVTMRTGPSLVSPTGSGYYNVYNNNNGNSINSFAGITTTTPQVTQLLVTPSGLTAGGAGWTICANSGASVAFSAEL
jgi:hypothetical protein